MSLTNLLVPTYTQMLRGMSGWLDKTQKQLPEAEAEALLSARLVPDMFPLSSQIRFACFQSQEAAFLLREEPVPEDVQRVAQEGLSAGEQPGSMADAKVRIVDALSFLESLDKDALDVPTERTITLVLPTGTTFDMTAQQYIRDWALPQFYFHVVTAYAILRGQGIDLGKADYVAHMFAYLRPGTMAES